MPEHLLEKPSSGQQRWAVGLALLAFIAALVGGIVLGFGEPPGQVRLLPPGGTLELRGWTLTSGETFFDGNVWQRLARGLQVPGLELGGYRGSHDAPSGLALWFRSSDDRPLRGGLRGIWIDEHGCRISAYQELRRRPDLVPVHMPIPPRWALNSTPGAIPPAPEVRWAASPDVRPRRGAGPLTFAFLREGVSGPIAAYTVSRPPDPPAYPRWTSSPTPLTASDGNTTFILDRLRHGTARSWAYLESIADFRYQGPDRRSTSWHPALVTVSDATGNSLTTPTWTTGPTRFLSLCTREPAWKLKVRFARPDPAAVPPDLVWTWRDVPISGKPSQDVPHAFVENDVRVALDAVTRRHPDPWEVRGSAAVAVTVDCPEGFMLTLTRVTDDRGRTLDPPASYSQTVTQDRTRETSSTQALSFALLVHEDTKRLNLTFALHRTRTVEFAVRP